VYAAQEYKSENCWIRQPFWANFHGDFGTAIGVGMYLHILRP